MTFSKQQGLFGSYRQCGICGKRLPDSYKEQLCPSCMDIQLLRDVKDFIRENDVNEYQVAEYFDIPVRMVKEWIREGRIEYKQNNANGTIAGMHCQRCGANVSFGSLCPACLKLLNGSDRRGYGKLERNGNEKMRFLDLDNE